MALTYQEIPLEHGALFTGLMHPPTQCKGESCTIHNRSDHHMRDMRQHWRDDRGMMERICEHGVGHPDPDEYVFTNDEFTNEERMFFGVHGCDGCCVKENNNDAE